MLIGIISDASHAEILLNNLSEADFNLADVSILMSDIKQRNLIAKDKGPMKGWDAGNLIANLVKKGLPSPKAEYCAQAIKQGKVLFAMKITPDLRSAASEMIKDNSGEIIQE